MSQREVGLMERWLPGLGTIRNYRRAWLRHDVVAGIVLAVIQRRKRACTAGCSRSSPAHLGRPLAGRPTAAR